MNFQKTTAASLLALSLVAPGLALAESEWHNQAGELGWTYHQSHAKQTKASAEVMKELASFQKNPVSADGQYRDTRSDVGAVLVQHSYSLQNGKLVDTDKLSHNTPAPETKMTAEEAAARRALYTPG